MQVPFYPWYAAPALVGLSIVTGAGLAALLTLARRAGGLWRGRAERDAAADKPATAASPIAQTDRTAGLLPVAIGGFLVLVAGYPGLSALHRTAQRHPALQVYADVGHWLREQTPPDSSVGYYEIGYVGYYSERRVIDSLGLVDPAVSPHVAQGDLVWAFRHYRPTYILEKPGAGKLNGFHEEPWFAREYRARLTFASPDGAPQHQVIVYERVEPARQGE
jgi:hypothetical protein